MNNIIFIILLCGVLFTSCEVLYDVTPRSIPTPYYYYSYPYHYNYYYYNNSNVWGNQSYYWKNKYYQEKIKYGPRNTKPKSTRSTIKHK